MLKRLSNLYRKYFWTPEKYARAIGVKIGSGCAIATRYFGSEPYLIEIGNHVQVTSDVRFFTHGGGWVFRHKYPNMDTFGKIKVGNNVYIGNCSFILPGVEIGNNVIIGSGSIVTKSIPDDKIVAGNPAKIIGDVADLEEKLVKFNVDSKGMDANQKKKYLLSLNDEMFIKK